MYPPTMNIWMVGKRGAQLGLCAVLGSILLLPVQAAERVPVPLMKPPLPTHSLLILPTKKPKYAKIIPTEKPRQTAFQAMTLNLGSLLSTDQYFETRTVKVYPHNYAPLSSVQSKIYSDIFRAQALGDVKTADEKMKTLKDKRLVGHVLYQRYMHPSYKTSFSELQSWMEHYADFPGAHRVYKLAVSRRESGSEQTIKTPENGKILAQVGEPKIYHAKTYQSTSDRTKAQKLEVRKFSRKIRSLVRKSRNLNALELFQDAPEREFMDTVEQDVLLTKISEGFLYSKNFEFAHQLAAQSSERSGEYVPKAAWVAGLALWQQGQFAEAAVFFDRVGQSEYSSGWLASAGSYWAARSFGKAGDDKARRASLARAAKHTRTFYGLLATHALGQSFDFNWDVPEYTTEHEALVLAEKGGKRAYDLVAAGQYDLAETELMRLNYRGNKALSSAVLAYASHVGLPGVALRLGNMVKHPNNGYYDSALYPVSPWSPKDGYRLDPALVHAVIRQESRFDQQAVSYSGAVGLMQIMPKTATYVAKTKRYAEGINTSKLRLPETNMKVGQDYLEYLLEGNLVKGDVVSLLVSYNAGPGNLQKWKSSLGQTDDTLLFIEMVPIKETRDYVERVLSNYWIYRLRAGLKLPSLAALSGGQSPKYAHVMQEEYPYKLAANDY